MALRQNSQELRGVNHRPTSFLWIKNTHRLPPAMRMKCFWTSLQWVRSMHTYTHLCEHKRARADLMKHPYGLSSSSEQIGSDICWPLPELSNDDNKKKLMHERMSQKAQTACKPGSWDTYEQGFIPQRDTNHCSVDHNYPPVLSNTG